MYRFLLFAHRLYEASGGMGDLVFTFNTVDELQRELDGGGTDIEFEFNDTFEIYDVKKDEVYRYEINYGDSTDGIFDSFINDNL